MNNDFRIGPWLVQPSLDTISQNGTSTRVEPKVMEVLVCLSHHPGEPVTKDELLQTVWRDTFVSDDVLKRSVSELRRVFEDNAREPRIIETIPKRGYRLIAAVQPANGVSRPPSFHISHGSAEHQRLYVRWWPVLAVLGLSALVLSVLVGLDVAGLRTNLFSKNTQPSIRSLAVLPLASLSDDPAQEYFADGVTDALITDLAQISALKVVSRTTTTHYKNIDKPLSQIARELNVDAIVEGTVHRSGDRVRMTVQLIYGPADRHLWAASFERDARDVLALQSGLATEIAKQIHVNVTPQEDARLKSLHPVNPKALDAFVEAQFHLGQAGKFEFYKDSHQALQEELRKGVSYLDRAIQEDPEYMPAYVAYFDAVDAPGISHLEFLPKAKTALTKALTIDPTNVAAHLALGRLLMQYEYDWSGAEREYKRAIEVNPSSSDTHFAYSEFLENIGRPTDGDKERELAQSLSPARDYSADSGVHRLGTNLEQDRQALEEKAPNDPFALGSLAKEYAVDGRYKESVELWERCLALYGWHDFVTVLKRADAAAGPKFALQEWMRAIEEYSNRHDDFPVFIPAMMYSSIGDKDRAFAWLDKAVTQRNWCIIYLKLDRAKGDPSDDWKPLRSDPRFQALLRRVGLAHTASN